MDLLHDVEGDGHNTARVLTNSHAPGRGITSQEVNAAQKQILNTSRSHSADSPRPRLVGLIQNEQRRLVVTVKELHVDNVEQLLV